MLLGLSLQNPLEVRDPDSQAKSGSEGSDKNMAKSQTGQGLATHSRDPEVDRTVRVQTRSDLKDPWLEAHLPRGLCGLGGTSTSLPSDPAGWAQVRTLTLKMPPEGSGTPSKILLLP